MEKIRLQTEIEVHPGLESLSSEEQELMNQAREVLKSAYAPYSRFQVGAVIRLANGKIVSGVNVENAAYPLCICAEQVAVGAAASRFPEVPITTIAIAVRSENSLIDHPAAPCGACRQVLSEAEDRHRQPICILLQGEKGKVYRIRSVKDILPLSFDRTYL